MNPDLFSAESAKYPQPRATPWVNGTTQKTGALKGRHKLIDAHKHTELFRPFRARISSLDGLPRTMPWAFDILPFQGKEKSENCLSAVD